MIFANMFGLKLQLDMSIMAEHQQHIYNVSFESDASGVSTFEKKFQLLT